MQGTVRLGHNTDNAACMSLHGATSNAQAADLPKGSWGTETLIGHL